MKRLWPVWSMMMLLCVESLVGQQVKDDIVTILPATTLTSATATNSIPVDLKSYDAVAIAVTVVQTNAVDIAFLRPQWSQDAVTWYDEPIFNSGTVVGGDRIFVYSSKVITVPMNTATSPYIERSRRLAKYLRYSVTSSNATSVATITIKSVPANNNN